MDQKKKKNSEGFCEATHSCSYSVCLTHQQSMLSGLTRESDQKVISHLVENNQWSWKTESCQQGPNQMKILFPAIWWITCSCPFGLVFFEHTAYIRSAVKYLAKKKIYLFAGGLSDTALRIRRSYFSKAWIPCFRYLNLSSVCYHHQRDITLKEKGWRDTHKYIKTLSQTGLTGRLSQGIVH